MRSRIAVTLLVIGLVIGVSGTAFAFSSYKTQFNTRYGTTGSAIDQCILCHATNNGPGIPSTETPANPYGVALETNGLNFASAESQDSDGDGFTNIAEITARTFPGNAASRPAASDVTLPTVSAFTVPAASSSLTVSITSFAATDNVGVTGFMVTESATKPLATAAGWTATAPTSYTAATAGTKTLFAWAKDAAGNVSNSLSASVVITLTVPPPSGDIVDFDGDGKTDIAVYRSSTGAWFIVPSSGAAPYGLVWGGDPTDSPVPGEYDGDGKTDAAVYRGGTGAWYVHPSSGAVSYGIGWGGGVTDKPVPGDYDGDGKVDLAVYRDGLWFVSPSGGGAPHAVGWGTSADLPVPGDYDGDGKTDNAIYRDGTWFVSPSGGGAPYAVGWGIATDEPVPGDYDGDGKTDIAIYRSSTGGWFIIPSLTGTPYAVGWGGDPTDMLVVANSGAFTK